MHDHGAPVRRQRAHEPVRLYHTHVCIQSNAMYSKSTIAAIRDQPPRRRRGWPVTSASRRRSPSADSGVDSAAPGRGTPVADTSGSETCTRDILLGQDQGTPSWKMRTEQAREGDAPGEGIQHSLCLRGDEDVSYVRYLPLRHGHVSVERLQIHLPYSRCAVSYIHTVSA